MGMLHPETALLLNRAGNFCFDREKFDQALQIYREGLVVEQSVLSPSHPNVIVTYLSIGEIHKKKGNFARAIKLYLYTKAMQLQNNNFGEASVEVASSLNAIGWLYEQSGQSRVALRLLQEALVMCRTILGDNQLDVAASLTDVGTLFCRNNMFHDAFEVLAESLQARREQLGCDHRDVSFTMYNMGLCHQAQGIFREAFACFGKLFVLRYWCWELGTD
jgi:tetratricopeptide (TPR) repeat protein